MSPRAPEGVGGPLRERALRVAGHRPLRRSSSARIRPSGSSPDSSREALLDGRGFQDLLPPGGQIYYETHFAPLLRMQGSVNEIALELRDGAGERIPVLVNAAIRRGHRRRAGRPADRDLPGPRPPSLRAGVARDRTPGARDRRGAAAEPAVRRAAGGRGPGTINVSYAPGVRGARGRRRLVRRVLVGGAGPPPGADRRRRRRAWAARRGRRWASCAAPPGRWPPGPDGAGQVLEALDRYARRHRIGQMTTLVYCELDLDRHRLRYACAGHPPPLLLVPGRAARAAVGRPFAAARHRPEAAPPSGPRRRLSCPRGSTVLLFTDGLVERRDQPQHDGLRRVRGTGRPPHRAAAPTADRRADQRDARPERSRTTSRVLAARLTLRVLFGHSEQFTYRTTC